MNNPGKPRGRYEPEILRKIRGGTTAAEMLKDVLERQQAQIKSAERLQEKAAKNAAGHIMGKEEEEKTTEVDPEVLKEDLATLENADGCWDDSDDDEVGLVLNHSRVSLATTTSSKSEDEKSEPLDAWDL